MWGNLGRESAVEAGTTDPSDILRVGRGGETGRKLGCRILEWKRMRGWGGIYRNDGGGNLQIHSKSDCVDVSEAGMLHSHQSLHLCPCWNVIIPFTALKVQAELSTNPLESIQADKVGLFPFFSHLSQGVDFVSRKTPRHGLGCDWWLNHTYKEVHHMFQLDSPGIKRHRCCYADFCLHHFLWLLVDSWLKMCQTIGIKQLDTDDQWLKTANPLI